jgi:acyl carrier protein
MSTFEPMVPDLPALVRGSLAEALRITPQADDLLPDDLLVELPEMSSLAMLRSMVLIEERLGIELDDNELMGARTVGELTAVIAIQYLGRRGA